MLILELWIYFLRARDFFSEFMLIDRNHVLTCKAAK